MSGQRPAGFTLVEVLVALALLGMLTVAAYGTVRVATLTWHRVSLLRDADSERDGIVRVLRNAIEQSYPAFSSSEYGDRRIAFDGTSSEFVLVAPLPAAIEEGLMARERFYARTTERDKGLFMSWALDLPTPDGSALPAHTVRLADGSVTLRLAYFGAAIPDQPSVWSDHWRGMAGLPELVHLLVWRGRATGRPWIDVTIETWRTMNTDCVYVPGEIACRRLE